jgi:Family of unknown function (DUF6111)
MIRPILLFLTPFVLYAVFLWGTRAGVLHPSSWSWSTLGWLTMAALALVVGSFIVMAQYDTAPPGSTYVPAHIENGRFVPGTTQ